MSHTSVETSVRDPFAKPLPLRHPSYWIAAVVVGILLVLTIYVLATNDSVKWDVFARYLFSPPIMEGLWVTIQLSVISQILALAIGCILALLGESKNPTLRLFVTAYVGFFRGLPLLVLLLLIFNAALFIPTIGFGPLSLDTNDVITGFSAAIIGLSLHEGAFMTEVIRAGLLSVPKGQREAAQSIGMKPGTTMRSIVLPQAIRIIIPPTGNQFIGLLKASSLVAVIGGGDLLTRAQQLYGSNFQVIPLLFVVSFWYLVLVTLATVGQHFLEKRFSQEGGPRKAARATVKEVAA